MWDHSSGKPLPILFLECLLETFLYYAMDPLLYRPPVSQVHLEIASRVILREGETCLEWNSSLLRNSARILDLFSFCRSIRMLVIRNYPNKVHMSLIPLLFQPSQLLLGLLQ